MLGESEHTSDKGWKKKTSLVAVLAAVACLSTAVVYDRFGESSVMNEINDGTVNHRAFGYAGYAFINHPMTWDQAHHWCLNHGMVLATVDEPWKLRKVRQVSGNRMIWIGYRAVCNQLDRNCYRWMSGARRGWSNWAPHEPNNLPGEHCVELMANGQFNNHNCGRQRFPFVCDKSPFIQGYAMHGVNGRGVGFDHADAMCRERYGTGLATLGDPENMHFVIAQSQAPTAWVGLRVTPGVRWHPNAFQMISGQPRRHPLRWAPGEPNQHHERCGELRGNGQLNDLPCNWHLKWFLCDQFVGNSRYATSTFEWNGERPPVRNNPMPNKFILFNGRRRYRWNLLIRLNGVTPHWTSIVHVGNNNHIRVPALWEFPGNQRRLHFRQGSNGNWNEGCDPTVAVTPPIRHWFRIDVHSMPNNYRVHYNGALRCHRPITLAAVLGKQAVFIGDPWHIAAPVTIQQMRFVVF